jgi:hypothetical protein
LPTEYQHLPKLANLNLGNNRLRKPIPSQIFTGTNITNLLLNGNQLTTADIQDMDGVQEYMERRKHRVDKALWQDIEIKKTLCGL